jgi:hypothetical protein
MLRIWLPRSERLPANLPNVQGTMGIGTSAVPTENRTAARVRRDLLVLWFWTRRNK